MMDLKAARYVTVLAQCKTVRAAAEILYISPPALSMYIRNLEKELGTALFIRENKTFVPTEIGRRYIRRSLDILEINQKFEAELRSYLRKEQNKISIGLYKRRGISFMVPLIQALQKELPNVQFTFRIGSMQELEQMLAARQIDYILVTHRIHKAGYSYTHICNDELLIACPASWRPVTRQCADSPYPVISVENLPADKIIVPDSHQSIYPFISHFADSHGISLSGRNPVANMEIAVQSVSAEMGFCFTLASYVSTFSYIPSPVFCRPGEKNTSVSWSLAFLDDPLGKTRLSVLKNTISAQIKSMM